MGPIQQELRFFGPLSIICLIQRFPTFLSVGRRFSGNTMKPRDFPTDRIKTQPASSSAGPFSSLHGGTNWARTWFSHRVSEKTSALHEAQRDAFILYCRRLGLQECLFPLPHCSLLFYCGGKKKREKDRRRTSEIHW